MRLGISRQGDVPVREQLVTQILLTIATGELQPGDLLPSVRALALRLKIHHNTVSQAYSQLVLGGYLVRRRGRRLAVRLPDESSKPEPGENLDALIDSAIAAGHTLHELNRRVQDRIREEPPERVLLVSKDIGLRIILKEELRQELGVPIDSCSPDELKAKPQLALGSLVAATPGAMSQVRSLLPSHHPLEEIRFADASDHMERIRTLKNPSIIAIVTVSAYFLKTAHSLLSPIAGEWHSIAERLVNAGDGVDFGAADIVVCDSIVGRVSPGDNVLIYRMLASRFQERISKILRR